MKVKEVMVPVSKLVTADENLTLDEVSKIILEHHIGCVVLIGKSDDKEHEAVPVARGIITKTDLVRAYLTGPDAGKKKISGFSLNKLLLCHENSTTEEVSKYMVDYHVHHILVHNDKKKICGLVTTFDLTRDFCENSQDKLPYFKKLFSLTSKNLENVGQKLASTFDYLIPSDKNDAYYFPWQATSLT